jgi:Glycosyltransferase family 9 (heptosyltransferase)
VFSEIRDYIASRSVEPRVLLFYGSQCDEGLGDIFVGSRHYRCLQDIFPKFRFMVHTRQSESWRAACGAEIECIAQLPRDLIVNGLDLMIFDTGGFSTILPWVERSSAIAIDVPALTECMRIRHPETGWRHVKLPTEVNRPRRIWEVYEALGFKIERHKLSSPRGAVGGIFVNPYASFGLKSMCAPFLSELLEMLPRTCGGNTIICPPLPPHPPEDAAVFAELNRIVHATAQRQQVCIVQLNANEYIELIRSSKLVIGPDTSTQHIAANFGTPSIACFVPEAGYRYLFWASFGPGNVCVRIPRRKSAPEVRAAAEMTASLASAMLESDLGQQSSFPIPPSLQSFVDVCNQIARRRLDPEDGAAALQNAKKNLRALVPETWQRFVVPELTRIARGICRRAASMPDQLDPQGIAELENINAVQVIALLGESSRQNTCTDDRSDLQK